MGESCCKTPFAIVSKWFGLHFLAWNRLKTMLFVCLSILALFSIAGLFQADEWRTEENGGHNSIESQSIYSVRYSKGKVPESPSGHWNCISPDFWLLLQRMPLIPCGCWFSVWGRISWLVVWSMPFQAETGLSSGSGWTEKVWHRYKPFSDIKIPQACRYLPP